MAHFTIRKDRNTWSMSDQPEATIVEWYGGKIVVKVAGHMEQHGRGIRSYKPAEYQVWQITEISDCGEIMTGQADFLIDFPVNPKLQGRYITYSTSTA